MHVLNELNKGGDFFDIVLNTANNVQWKTKEFFLQIKLAECHKSSTEEEEKTC